MKIRHFTAALLLFAACRTSPPPAPPAPQKEVSAAALADHAGDSVETAVAIPAEAADGGVHFENEWIFGRFGKFRRYAGGTGTVNGRRYDVVKIELPDGVKKTIYFDITENWDRWTPR